MEVRIDQAWAAGLFEGEGSITVLYSAKARRPKVQLSITSTDLDVLRRFRKVAGAGQVYGPYREGTKHRPQYSWRAHGFDLLSRLYDEWKAHLGKRRRERFEEVLAQKPDPYVRRNLSTRRLTNDEVLFARSLLRSGRSQAVIARTLDVSQETISALARGKTYKEVL